MNVRFRFQQRKQKTYELIEKLRSEIPGIAIRTTLLVGHPGETEQDFNELVEFVKNTRFDKLGVFPYSHEEHAFAGKHYTDDVPEKIKAQRVEEIMKIQQDISHDINQLKVGKTLKVIIDRREGEYWIGRTESDSPEVDGEVLIKSETEIKPGNFYNVKITEADEYDLFGKLFNDF